MEVRTHITIMKQAALTNEALGLTRKELILYWKTMLQKLSLVGLVSL